MISELFIENQKADISSSLASLLTLAIDDIKDFSSRQTSFSKTIILPGSANNNKILGSIFEIAIRNDYDSALPNVGINFNASASASCILFQDFLQTFQGNLRILQINIDAGRIEYEAAIAGTLSILNVKLSSGLLEDLDFSAYNHTYNETNIATSWDHAFDGFGYYYPLIDYGTYSVNKHDWDLGTFRPALFVKEYIDKMFQAAGFRYQSALLNTTRFKGLIVPHNQKALQTVTTRLLSASRNNVAHVLDSGTAPVESLNFSSVVTSIFTVSPANDKFTFTGASPANLVISGSIFGNYTANTVGYTLVIKKNGVDLSSTTYTISRTFDTSQRFYTWNYSVNVSLATGDYIEVFYSASSTISGPDYITATNGTLFIDSSAAIATDVNYGDFIQMNYTIPKNIRQIDFLVAIVKLFNLYITEDKFDDRLLYIEPYVDFYSIASQNAVDWTLKLDRATVAGIKPMSEINAKIYNFTYDDDSDYYNDLYKKRYNAGYGSYIYDTAFEFVDQQEDIKLIFASTPIVGYAGEEKVYSTIFKMSSNNEETTDSKIRILQAKKITGVASWILKDGSTTLASYTAYGYAGHFNDPDNVTNDLNFGAPEELFFILVAGDLTVTQFNLYWSAYMAEITDKDSKLLTGKFYLTPQDILNLDFSKYVNVDDNLFRLNKITDYNLTKPDTCLVELLKVINTLY